MDELFRHRARQLMDLPQRIEHLECYSDRLRRQNRWLTCGLLVVGFGVLLSTFRPEVDGFVGAAGAGPTAIDVARDAASSREFPIVAATADGRQFLIDMGPQTPLAIEISGTSTLDRPPSTRRSFDPSAPTGVQFAAGPPVNRIRERKLRSGSSVE